VSVKGRRLLRLLSFLVFLSAAIPANAQSIQNEGGCIIGHLRATNKPVSPLVDQACNSIPNATMPGGRTFQENYAWVMPYLMNGMDNAERAQCGVPGCATGQSHLRLVLYYDGTVNVLVDRNSKNEITIAISAGTIDFTEATTIMMLQDFKDDPDKAAPNGLRKWLEGLSTQGGLACRLRYDLPKFTLDLQQNFDLIRASAGGVYTFILAHELSHILAGSSCGVPPTAGPLAIETACDRIAFSKLADVGFGVPLQIIAWFVSVHRYETLAGPILAPPNMRLETAFPARNWTARAKSIHDQWSAFCKTSTAAPTCATGWRDLSEYSDDLIDIDLPADCKK
jgi:hypothetical protein